MVPQPLSSFGALALLTPLLFISLLSEPSFEYGTG